VKVEVADEVLRIDPPLKERPLDEKRPPCPASTVPLEKVLVAVLVCRIDPPLIVIPAEESSPPVFTPPLKVEVPVPPTFNTSVTVVEPVEARRRRVVVEVLASLRVPKTRSPAVVEANQKRRSAPAPISPNINWGEEVEFTCSAPNAVVVPMARRPLPLVPPVVYMERKLEESMVEAPE